MKYTIVDEWGVPLSRLDTPKEFVNANTPQGCKAISGHPPFENCRYLSGVWQQLPSKPSSFHTWSGSLEQWVDTRSPEVIAEHQRNEINRKRDESLDEFYWHGTPFDADASSRLSITAVSNVIALTGELPTNPLVWRSANNKDVVIVNRDEWTSFVTALAKHDIKQHTLARESKQSITT